MTIAGVAIGSAVGTAIIGTSIWCLAKHIRAAHAPERIQAHPVPDQAQDMINVVGAGGYALVKQMGTPGEYVDNPTVITE